MVSDGHRHKKVMEAGEGYNLTTTGYVAGGHHLSQFVYLAGSRCFCLLDILLDWILAD